MKTDNNNSKHSEDFSNNMFDNFTEYKPEIHDKMLVKWQKIVDLMATIIGIPAGLIMKVHKSQIEVFLASSTKGNPYKIGERADLNTGLYCETVMTQRTHLLVPDAQQDPKWADNPDIKLGMVSYLGFPLIWPDGELFGTICVLDNKENAYSTTYEDLIKSFKEIIEMDLWLLFDKTEHKRMRDILEQKEKLIKATLESTADGILVVDEEGKVIHTNTRFASMWHIPHKLISSRDDNKLLDFVLEQLEDPDAFLSKVRYLYGTTLENLDTLKFKDGRIFERYSCPLTKDNKIAGRVWSFRDISERKQAENELAEKNRLNQIFLDALPCIALLLLPDREIILSNRAGKKANIVPGARCYEAFCKRDTPCPWCLAPKALLSGEPQRIEIEDHGKVWDIHWIPIKPDLYLHYFFDITDRKKLEQERLKMEKLESVGILAGGIAHDFNNLLTGIMGNISLAKLEYNSDDESFVNLEEAEKAITRARDLTQQLLTFSKGGEPIKESASIEQLLRDTVSFALHGSNVKPKFSFADNLLTAEIDVNQISQVIHNLILNAVQAMPSGGKVIVSAENVTIKENNNLSLNAGQYVKITVRDEGTGISQEHLQKIYDPYFTTKRSGTGLGLTIVYSIIKKHSGHIEVESEIGVGTTFHIYLPACVKKPSIKKNTVEIIETKNKVNTYSGTGRILVMDDEELIRNLATKVLNKFGFEVDCAEDGVKAIELYKKAKENGDTYAAVILDLTVPGGMGGKETIKKLREIDPKVKAIVCSGYSNDPVMADHKKYFFSGVVSKPYRPRELGQAVNELLETTKIPVSK